MTASIVGFCERTAPFTPARDRCGIEVGANLLVHCCDSCPRRTVVRGVFDYERDAEICLRSALHGNLAELTGQIQVRTCPEEEGLASHNGCILYKILGYDLQVLDAHIEILDGEVVVCPEVLHIIIGGGEVLVRFVYAAVIVAEVNGGVESVNHKFLRQHEVSVLYGTICRQDTILEGAEVGLGLNQRGTFNDRDGVVGTQVKVARCNKSNRKARRKYF